jgi:hypothetical protein
MQSRWRGKTRRKTVIKIECDGKYCYQEYGAQTEPEGWRQVSVRTISTPLQETIVVTATPLEMAKLDTAASTACGKHWREVARKLATRVDIFIEPDTPISEAPKEDIPF